MSFTLDGLCPRLMEIPSHGMKLSEAIRLGSMMKPPAKGKLWDHETGGSCAAGAALDAIGRLHPRALMVDLIWYFPIASQPAKVLQGLHWCSGEPGETLCLASWIAFLNDSLDWTREQIADCVEHFEKQQEGRQDKEETQVEATCA